MSAAGILGPNLVLSFKSFRPATGLHRSKSRALCSFKTLGYVNKLSGLIVMCTLSKLNEMQTSVDDTNGV